MVLVKRKLTVTGSRRQDEFSLLAVFLLPKPTTHRTPDLSAVKELSWTFSSQCHCGTKPQHVLRSKRRMLPRNVFQASITLRSKCTWATETLSLNGLKRTECFICWAIVGFKLLKLLWWKKTVVVVKHYESRGSCFGTAAPPSFLELNQELRVPEQNRGKSNAARCGRKTNDMYWRSTFCSSGQYKFLCVKLTKHPNPGGVTFIHRLSLWRHCASFTHFDLPPLGTTQKCTVSQCVHIRKCNCLSFSVPCLNLDNKSVCGTVTKQRLNWKQRQYISSDTPSALTANQTEWKPRGIKRWQWKQFSLSFPFVCGYIWSSPLKFTLSVKSFRTSPFSQLLQKFT